MKSKRLFTKEARQAAYHQKNRAKQKKRGQLSLGFSGRSDKEWM